MRLGQTLPQLAELGRATRAAMREYGEGPAAVLRRMRRLRARGFTYTEAVDEGLLDPAMPDGVRGRYLSRHVREIRQNVLNPLSLEDFTEEKLTFARYAESLGIPVPRTYGTAGRAGGWNRVAGRMVTGPDGFARMVAEDLADEFVIKPVLGYLGLGLRVLRRDGAVLVDQDGRRIDAAALHAELDADPAFDLFLIQERLHNHPDVDALHASPMLQTSRVTSLVTAGGQVRMLFVSLKVGTGTGGADNYRVGETGNGVAYVDLDTGLLGPALVPRPGRLGPIPASELDGHPIEGRPMPLLAECLDLVTRHAHAFLPMRTLGWDIALTARGPVVVEVNNFWASPHGPLTDEAWDLFFRG